jgi:hypothetical protein
MQLRKVVSIACLTYIVYGITSAFQLGTFLPPIPLKPFIILFFIIIGFVFALRSKVSLISYILLSWLLLFALNSHAFLEVSLKFETFLFYEEHLSLYVSLIMMLIFLWYNTLLLMGAVKVDKRFWLLFIPLLVMVIFHFMNSYLFPFSYVIMGSALLSYMLERKLEERLPKLFELTSILYGAAIIEAVEIISLRL